jgi:hypothetical protein
VPRIAHGPVVLDRRVRLRQGSDDLHGRREHTIVIAADQFLIPFPSELGGQDLRIAAQQLRHEAIHFCMVGDDEEVERTRELHAKAMCGGNFLATSESERVLLSDPVHRSGVDRNGSVQVRITPENLGREIPASVGRKLSLGDFGNIVFGQCLMIAWLLRPSYGCQSASGEYKDGFCGAIQIH